MGKCYSIIRYLMFSFNLLFLLLGMALVGIGVWVRLDESLTKYGNMTEEQVSALHTCAYVIIVIGAVIMITSFMGCCGAIIENQCMLVIFFILLLIIAIVFFAAGAWAIWAFSVVKTAEDAIKKGLEEGIEQYSVEDSVGRAYVDLVQKNFKCCGASRGVVDYVSAANVDVLLIEECQKYPTEPCVEKVMGTVNSVVTATLAIIFLTAAVAVLGMIFSMVLCCAIRKRQ